MLRLFLILLLLAILSHTSVGQDIHLSQFYASPMLVNPAHTGYFNGDWRIVNNMRSQWSAIAEPYNSLVAGFERQFYIYNNNFSGGLLLVSDKAGYLRMLTNKILLSLSYHRLSLKNNWHFGLQEGYVFRSYNYSSATFPNQFDMSRGNFNKELPNNETALDAAVNYPLFNSGIIWNRKIRNLLPQAGIAFFNLNVPHETFLPRSPANALGLRQCYFAELGIDLAHRITMIPRLYYMRQKKSMEQISGSHLTLGLAPNKYKFDALFSGLYVRSTFGQQADAAIVVAGLSVAGFDIGINYDVNISGLREVSNFRGAFEISIIYKAASTIFDKYTIPCDRI